MVDKNDIYITTAADTGIMEWLRVSPTLKWQSLTPGAEMHAPQKPGDVGYDLTTTEDTWVGPDPVFVPTGVAVEIPVGFWGLVCARSSALSNGIVVYSGVIDQGYRGPLFARASAVQPYQDEEVTREVKAGTRLAQLILVPAAVFPTQQVDTLGESERGAGGFGSTGGTL